MALVVKNPSANAGDKRDVGLIPGSGRSPGGGHGNPLQYTCLGNPMDRGACWTTVHRITKSQTQLSDLVPNMHIKPPGLTPQGQPLQGYLRHLTAWTLES